MPRSVVSGGPSSVPPIGPAESRQPPRRDIRRRLAAALAAGLIVAAAVLAGAGTQLALGRFADAASLPGSRFVTGAWAMATTWFLHNNPTPPTANTAAQFNLPLDSLVPVASVLRNYDTNCDSRAGRSLTRGTGLVEESATCRYATWRSSAVATARTISGTATLTTWARKTSNGGQNPTLRAFLRAFDPATSTWTELGAADIVIATNANQPWAPTTLGWPLAATVPAGRQIEVKLVATGGTRNVELAYDTTGTPATLVLP